MINTVAVFEAIGLTVSQTKTETMLLRTLNQVLPTSPLIVEAAGQRNVQTREFLYLGGDIDANADNIPHVKRRIRLAWTCSDRSKRDLYDMENAPFMLKSRLLMTEEMGTGVSPGLSAWSTSLNSERHTTTSC